MGAAKLFSSVPAFMISPPSSITAASGFTVHVAASHAAPFLIQSAFWIPGFQICCLIRANPLSARRGG
jgi:hypothetical protein